MNHICKGGDVWYCVAGGVAVGAAVALGYNDTASSSLIAAFTCICSFSLVITRPPTTNCWMYSRNIPPKISPPCKHPSFFKYSPATDEMVIMLSMSMLRTSKIQPRKVLYPLARTSVSLSQ